MEFRDELKDKYSRISDNLFSSNEDGYWSNLDRNENNKLISYIQKMTTREAIQSYYPELFEVIFSPKRGAGLEFINLTGRENAVDYGCMWGALTIPLAKRCKYVLGIDQTMDSLKFLEARLKEEKINNVDLLCGDLKNHLLFNNKFDIAIVNGVLEWIPEQGTIELKSYYGRYNSKTYIYNPREQQLTFLKQVNINLTDNGKLYLAIENRYDFKMFFGAKDPHANVKFLSILPRKIADVISKTKLGRPYVNWLYSFKGINKLLKESGFNKVDLYMCFPDYRSPDIIIPYLNSLKNFYPTISTRNASGKRTIVRLTARTIEIIIFKILKMNCLAPSIIVVASK